MSTEVHIFLAVANATAATRYPVGESHAMHIYVRQRTATDHDWAAAEVVAMQAGWTDVEFRNAGLMNPGGLEEPMRSCHETAVNDGHALLVYNEPVAAGNTG
jgi:hypothetical protein